MIQIREVVNKKYLLVADMPAYEPGLFVSFDQVQDVGLTPANGAWEGITLSATNFFYFFLFEPLKIQSKLEHETKYMTCDLSKSF